MTVVPASTVIVAGSIPLLVIVTVAVCPFDVLVPVCPVENVPLSLLVSEALIVTFVFFTVVFVVVVFFWQAAPSSASAKTTRIILVVSLIIQNCLMIEGGRS